MEGVIAPNTHLSSLQGKTGRGNMWLGGLPLLTDEPGVHRGPVLTATLLGIIMDETLDAWIGLRQSGQLSQSKCVAGLVAMRSLTGAEGSKKVRQFKLPAQWP